MSYDDFCRLAYDEFAEIYKQYRDKLEAHEQAEWERMRMLAAITIQPHCKKKILPKDLLPFPWEKPQKPKQPAATKTEDLKRFEKLVGKN